MLLAAERQVHKHLVQWRVSLSGRSLIHHVHVQERSNACKYTHAHGTRMRTFSKKNSRFWGKVTRSGDRKQGIFLVRPEIFTDAFLLLLYHGEKKKSKMAKNSNQGDPALTLFRAGGGGGGHIVPPPPPRVNFPKYLKNALSYRVETFWLFKWTNFQKKYLVFNCLRPPLVTIATPKVDACFRTTYFNSFHAKTPQNSKVFCYIFEGCPNWNLLWKFGLNIPLDGVLVKVFISHSFWRFNDLKMNTTTTRATPMVSFDLVFHKLSEKGYFFYFY